MVALIRGVLKEIITRHQQETKSQLFLLLMKVISPFYFLKKPPIKFPALNPEFVDIYAFALFRGGHITLMYMYMLQIALSLLPVKCKFN